jgi:PTH1 family peptidyl-tRNA hydrolase
MVEPSPQIRPRPAVRLVIGLGNPGDEYAAHRHNVGFWCVKRLARRWEIRLKASRRARIGEGQAEDKPIILARPNTFVNRSDLAVSALLQRYELSPQEMLVICDDLELPVGRIRIRPRGGHGGHNGLWSIIYALQSEDFPRLRIGIDRPRLDDQPLTDPEVVAAYVLAEPAPDEREALEQAVERAADAVACILRDGLEPAMNQYNR